MSFTTPCFRHARHQHEEHKLISHHHKCIFVHIPKCAGQSVENFFLRDLGLSWEERAPLLLGLNSISSLGPPRLAHLKARDYVANRWIPDWQFEQYFKFAFVRNPWDRAASFYRYLGYESRCSFDRFISVHLPKEMERNRWFICPQSDYIQGADGSFLVDYVGRFESLQNDFGIACGKMGLPVGALPHTNASRAGRSVLSWIRQKRPVVPYRDMYNEKGRALVAKLYEKDIDAFEYTFHPAIESA